VGGTSPPSGVKWAGGRGGLVGHGGLPFSGWQDGCIVQGAPASVKQKDWMNSIELT
jgi:hypothetical protein